MIGEYFDVKAHFANFVLHPKIPFRNDIYLQRIKLVPLDWYFFNEKICFFSYFSSHIIFFCCAPFGYLYFLIFYNEPELGVEIDPGMALTPLPSSIGRGLNPRPFIMSRVLYR